MSTRVDRSPLQDAADFADAKPVPEIERCIPKPGKLIIENIPAKLRSVDRWVVWAYEQRNGKLTKVPYTAKGAHRAACDNVQTWSALDAAVDAFHRGGWAGIGFMLGDGFVGIDLDKCIDPITGEIESEAAQIIRQVNSYTEKSPSGLGIHIIAIGTLPDGRRRKGHTEMYCGLRYFTITGDVVGDYHEVEERQAEIAAVHSRAFTQEAKIPPVGDGNGQKTDAKASVHPLVLDAKANPLFEKYDLLCQVEPNFRPSWEHEREDLNDQSASSYDMSLADYAARAGWTRQEITDLLIAHRRRYREDLKLRENYYGPTIAKAMEAAKKHWAKENAEQILNEIAAEQSKPETATAEPGHPEGDPVLGSNADGCVADGGTATSGMGDPLSAPKESTEGRREAILQALSTKFGITLKKIVKYVGDPPRFRVETETCTIDLGGVTGLIYQGNLRASLAAYTGRYLPHIPDHHWPKIAKLLLQACDPVERGVDATMKGTMTEWLSSYLEQKPPHESLEQADEAREPFLHEGGIHIFSHDFRRWLNLSRSERVRQDDLTANLRAIGAVPTTFDLVKGKPTSRSAWKLPAGPWAYNRDTRQE